MATSDDICATMDALGLRFTRRDDGRVQTGFAGRNTDYTLFLEADGPLVSVVAPELARIPASRMREAIELANLLNASRLRWGNFWVHPTFRVLAFELAIIAPGELTSDHMGYALAAAHACDDYFPAFGQVIWAGVTAEEAVAALSQGRSDDTDDEPDVVEDDDEVGFDEVV
ncbi:MAG: hypothetical protein DCC58_12035 [Chloroflexi bacterium]|nr:MAG: hypothetical protein DCC58_12035 [Chloroflexota bacterium]